MANPTVKCLVSFDDYNVTTPTWNDYTSLARAFTVTRGRPSELSTFDAGTCSVVFDNRGQTFEPSGGSFTYGIDKYGQSSYGSEQFARPMNRVWLYADYGGGVTYPIFKGFAERWERDWPGPGTSDATATVYASDEMKLLARADLPRTGTIAAGISTDQATFILDTIGSTTTRHIYSSGLGPWVTAVAARAMTGQDPLSELNASLETEIAYTPTVGGFFVNADGSLAFVPNGESAPYSSVVVVFGDAGGTELPYLDINVDYSDAFLTNQWTVSCPGLADNTATDTASVSQYGLRGQSKTLQLTSDALSLAAANQLVVRTRFPVTRVTSLRPNMADQTTAQAVLGLDLFYLVRVKRTLPGPLGGRLDQFSRILRIEMSGVAGSATSGVVLDVNLSIAPN